jgi:osmotically-inducible protein OsmY
VGYQVQGNTVTLSGKVRSLGVKGEAEDAVKHIEGVSHVVNNIEVLPPSPSDDALRMQVARALANRGGLSPYFYQAVPPIHIIVQGGNVSLEGVVNSQGDKDTANAVVQGIPGIFSVKNNLQVEPSGK